MLKLNESIVKLSKVGKGKFQLAISTAIALDIAQNNLVILELWGMQSTPLLPSLQGPLWPKVVAPGRVQPTVQIELNCTCAELNCLI